MQAREHSSRKICLRLWEDMWNSLDFRCESQVLEQIPQKMHCSKLYSKMVHKKKLAVPAWNGALTQSCKHDIERVKQTALHIMLGDSYGSYRNALETVSLESLDERRYKLCLKFTKKALRHEKHSK